MFGNKKDIVLQDTHDKLKDPKQTTIISTEVKFTDTNVSATVKFENGKLCSVWWREDTGLSTNVIYRPKALKKMLQRIEDYTHDNIIP